MLAAAAIAVGAHHAGGAARGKRAARSRHDSGDFANGRVIVLGHALGARSTR